MKKLLCFLVAALVPIQTMAAFQCDVSIQQVLVYSDGLVNVLHSGRGDYTVVCSLSAPRLGVDVVTCASWVSMLQHVKKNNGTAQFYYLGTGGCATLPTYSNSPAPLYIGSI